jgi:hypothetical protein
MKVQPFLLRVIAGLDPAIHKAVPDTWSGRMDARIKSGHDEQKKRK